MMDIGKKGKRISIIIIQLLVIAILYQLLLYLTMPMIPMEDMKKLNVKIYDLGLCN